MIGALSRNAIKAVVLVVVAAVVAGVAYYLLAGGATRTVRAQFTSAVGVYPGSDVRVLGIKIGTITKVTPRPSGVDVRMEYSAKYKIPADTTAVIVPPSVVSDRYVQLSVYKGGPVLADGAEIPESRTIVPVELDDIYHALNQLSVALGPNGANKNGALQDLVHTAAANLEGNGAALGQSIADLSRAARTLANGRGDLFTTVRNLQAFVQTLANSDAQVRHFNDMLAQVSGDLAGERAELAAALHNLTVALSTVSRFVKDNQASIHADVTGLVALTNILVKEKAALDETLAVAPVALSNLAHTYNPASGTLDNRSNLDSLVDPGSTCGLLYQAGELTGPNASKSLVQTCSQIAKVLQTTLGGLGQAVSGLLDNSPLPGGLPQIPGVPNTAPAPAGGLPSIPGVGG